MMQIFCTLNWLKFALQCTVLDPDAEEVFRVINKVKTFKKFVTFISFNSWGSGFTIDEKLDLDDP